MATLTKIVTGMEKGPEAINGNFVELDKDIAANAAVITNSSDGIAYTNGCTVSTGNPLHYIVYQIGTAKFVALKGQVNIPALDANKSVTGVTLPTSVTSGLSDTVGSTSKMWSTTTLRISLDTSSHLSFSNFSQAGNISAQSNAVVSLLLV